jgi:hypothetical protein
VSSLTDTVAEEVSDQVDIGEVVKGEGVVDQLEGSSLGRAVGEAVGAFLGRRLGDLLFGRLLGRLGIADGENTTRTGRLLRGLGVATARTLATPAVRDPAESALRNLIEKREGSAGESAGEGGGENDGEATAEVDAETLQSLKRETYRDLLERMDYAELQSLAEDAGVKANQKRETLVEELVEQFGDESAEDGTADDSATDSEDADESSKSETADDER